MRLDKLKSLSKMMAKWRPSKQMGGKDVERLKSSVETFMFSKGHYHTKTRPEN